MITWLKAVAHGWREQIVQHHAWSIGNESWCLERFIPWARPYTVLFWEKSRKIHSSNFSWRKQKLWILSKMIKLSFGISPRSSTINVSLHYNIKGNIHPLLSPIIFSLFLSFPPSALCSLVLWRKCQVKLRKTQRGLWCKCVWINTVWNASGISHHQNSYFTRYL